MKYIHFLSKENVLIFFVFFMSLLFSSCGENEIDKIPAPAKDFCASIHRNDSFSLSRELAPLEKLMESKTGVVVLEDGGNAILARAWLSEYAEKTIDIQYFIFSTDNVGLIACDYLVRAADRGIKVRILVDDILVDAGPHEILTLDSHENIEIKIYNPGINLGKNIVQKVAKFTTDFRKANQRMHNKTFTVDGKVVITGGRNIADEYFDYDHEYNFRDRDVMFMGKAVTTVENSFEAFWTSSLSVPVTQLVEEEGNDFKDKQRFERLHQYACNPENFWPQVREHLAEMPVLFKKIQNSGNLQWLDSVAFVSDIPGKNEERADHKGGVTTDELIRLVRSAKVSIDIQSPYLVTTDLGKKLFAETVKRGVKIRILTNSLASTDNLEAFSGYQRDRKKLLETGVRIFEFRPDAMERYKVMTGALQEKLHYTPVFGLHAKSMVIDGKVTVIGTFNLDPRSANLNTECLTVIQSEKIAEGVLKGMNEEFKPENSWETTSESNPDKEAGKMKRLNTFTRKVVPKKIL
ncbi:phospholipase D family protein [Sphingobacteriaceae bacterium]|nr:phospholipase D family protein [Sphingobacteriaceae bacterium]